MTQRNRVKEERSDGTGASTMLDRPHTLPSVCAISRMPPSYAMAAVLDTTHTLPNGDQADACHTKKQHELAQRHAKHYSTCDGTTTFPSPPVVPPEETLIK